YNDTGNNIIRVAVLPLHARIEIQRLASPKVEDFLSRDRLEHHRHHIVLRPVILIARCMGKQLTNRDLVGSRKVRDEPGDLVVKRQLALFLKKENRGGGELLAD